MTTMLKITLFALSTVALLAGCNGEVEDTRPGQPVKTRQMAFKEIVRTFEPMGVMLRNDRYEADKFTTLVEQLIAKRDGPWSHFGADTNYPPTKATPAVWTQAEKFEQLHQAFIKATDELALAAKARKKEAVEAPYKRVHDTCHDCHETFKKR